MSGPNHRYTHRWFQFGDMARQEKDDVRWTRTSGEEWDALMGRAREVLATPVHKEALAKGELLRDILAYIGELPSTLLPVAPPSEVCPDDLLIVVLGGQP